MDYSDADPTFRARFVDQKFDTDAFVQSIASKSIGSTDLVNLKGRMYLISSEAKTDLKQTVYRNHTKFIETAKQVALLESEVYQLHSLLGDEKQLLNTVKDLLNIENKSDSDEISDSQSWKTLVRHCQSLGLISKSDRELIYSGKFLDVKSENLTQKAISHNTQPYFGLLFNDCIILVKTSNIQTATAYDVDQVIKLHRSSLSSNANKFRFTSTFVQVINVKDEIIRNTFAIHTKLDTIMMICENAQIKKHWIEMIESVLYKDSKDYLRSISKIEEEEFFSEEWIKTIQEQLDILLAERNFNQTLKLINQAKDYISKFESKYTDQSFDFVDEFIKYIKTTQHELYRLIEKEILYICEKGCTTNLLKHYYHHIELLKQLGYISKACDLFFLLQISLMKNILKQTKIEEQNVVFFENFTNTFFTRLVDSYYEFVQIFKDQKSTFSRYIVWLNHEIDKFIILLHNQQYISSKNFLFSMKNIQILLTKSQEFSSKLIDIEFQIHEQLEPILLTIIRSQKQFIIDTLRQRHHEEKWIPITFQTHERLEQLLYEFYQLDFDGQKHIEPFIQFDSLPDDSIQIDLAPSTLQFTKAYLIFAKQLYQIHFQLINHVIVEALIELIKLHLKYYERTLLKITDKNLRDFIMKNVKFSLEHLCVFVEELYRDKIGNETKFFTKVFRKMDRFEELANL